MSFAWGLLKGAGKLAYELSLRTNPIIAPSKSREDLQALKSAHQELQRFADEDLQFVEELLSAQHSLEMTEAGGEVLFDVALSILTAGAGAAANIRHLEKLTHE